MTTLHRIRPLATAILLLIWFTSAWADQPLINPLINKGVGNVAIKGYDPVAYFVDTKPTPGDPKIHHEWNGTSWHFSSEANRLRFIKEPEHYAPQYGGYCAYAASVGQLADIDPQSWSIVDGRLYLNFSSRVKQIWKPRSKEFIGDANQLWPGLVKQHSQ